MANHKATLYYDPNSFYSQKVLLALDVKGVEHEKHIVALDDGENYAPWFMKINRMGQVPVLQHGHTYIADSKTVTEYIDDNFDGPALFPREVKDSVVAMIKLIDSIDIPTLTFGSILNPDMVTNVQFPPPVLAKLKEFVTSKPTQAALLRYKETCSDDAHLQMAYEAKLNHFSSQKDNFSRQQVQVALQHAVSVFEQVEKHMEVNVQEGCWMMASTITAADIAMAVCLHRMYLTGFAEALCSKRPHITTYQGKLLKDMPGYTRVCVLH